MVVEWRVNIAIIFTDYNRAKQILAQDIQDNTWRINSQIAELKQNHNLTNINIEVPYEWNILANKVAI